MDRAAVRAWLVALHDELTLAVERCDGGARCRRDTWQRAAGGGGETRVLRDGALLEQGGISFAHVHGSTLPPAATRARAGLEGAACEAMGVSLVLHPRSPYVPATHLNLRFLVAEPAAATPVWWFGGGFDLTPCYPWPEDVLHWHRTAAAACADCPPGTYQRFKAWCDRYFWLPHRHETRGVGGLFFDDLCEWGFDATFAFVRRAAAAFLAGWLPIVERRRCLAWGERERQFQLYRRGRYVEFNLLHDRGTLFGLESGGRTESILMSLPPLARWEYDWQPVAGSAEALLYRDYLRPRDWLGEAAAR
ncbi:MAG: oxygen-dependent coproporphyrinogen oxidase [Gammaproteobacteria bacterium]|nr:oxygen-dependent coproporphyrinogen oxidase [Gammaproteobacteria bacterium]